MQKHFTPVKMLLFQLINNFLAIISFFSRIHFYWNFAGCDMLIFAFSLRVNILFYTTH